VPEVLFENSITSGFTFSQGRLSNDSLQLFTNTENSEYELI